MGIVIGIVVVAAIVAWIVISRKKALPKSTTHDTATGTSTPAQTVPDKGESDPQDATSTAQPESVDSPDEERRFQSTPTEPDHTPSAPAPEEIAAEGVRLDESAEAEAANQLKSARRERKLKKLRTGLSKTRGGLIGKLASLFKEKKEIDQALLNELEEALITSDVGGATTEWLLGMLREALDKNELKDPDAVWAFLKSEVHHALDIPAPPWDLEKKKPFTIMVVGVNGAGKTTTIGKLASQFHEQGKKVVLAAADTFRAAAVNQLEIWGRRTHSTVIKPKKEGADPSSVVFDAVKTAINENADVVIADTAGRLHTKAPLMEELKKIHRVMGKAMEGAPDEVLLVLDATTGQNAMAQTREFGSALPLTGIALTKLDGTAKGGVIIGICHENQIPVRYIGIGESKDSLRAFEVDDFTEALFNTDADDE